MAEAGKPLTTQAVQAMLLAKAEFDDIHAKLDALEVPRTVEGEKLSASQRVSVLVGAYKSACTRVCKGA